MAYSASDFSDDVFNHLVAIGAIYQEEADDLALIDNQALMAEYAIRGINRLQGCVDALRTVTVRREAYGPHMADAFIALNRLGTQHREVEKGLNLDNPHEELKGGNL